MMRSVLFLLCLTVAAVAEPREIALPLSIEDQNNLREVCKAAMQNMNLATPMVYSISGWCLQKAQQVQQLVDKPKEEPK